MKRTLLLLFSLAFALSAADVWTAKPFTDWNDKEIQKMMTDSPWAKKVAIASPDGPGARGGASGGGGGAGGGGRGGRGGRGGGGGADDSGGAGGNETPTTPLISVVVRWQTSLPVRQAVARIKYGKEATTSEDAKKLLDKEQQFYILVLSGVPSPGKIGEEFRQGILKSATLTAKGKDSLQPGDVQLDPHGNKVDVYVVFPRQRVYTVEDGELELNVKAGRLPIKQKFKLKDMMFNGKLEL